MNESIVIADDLHLEWTISFYLSFGLLAAASVGGRWTLFLVNVVRRQNLFILVYVQFRVVVVLVS